MDGLARYGHPTDRQIDDLLDAVERAEPLDFADNIAEPLDVCVRDGMGYGFGRLPPRYWQIRDTIHDTLKAMKLDDELPHGLYLVRRTESGWWVDGSGMPSACVQWGQVADILMADVVAGETEE